MIAFNIKTTLWAVYIFFVLTIIVSNINYFYSNSYPEYLPGDMKNLEMLTKNVVFEGKWAIDKPFKQLKHNYGKAHASFKDYTPKDSSSSSTYKILRIYMSDSRYSSSTYLVIDLLYASNLFLTSRIYNQGNESLPLGGSVAQYIDGIKTETFNLALTGKFKFNEAILTTIKGVEKAINTNSFFTNQSLIKGTVGFAGNTQSSMSLWEGSSPQINFNLAYGNLDGAVQSFIYHIFMISILMLSIYGSMSILSKMNSDPNYRSTISLPSLVMACLWDMSFFWVNLYLGSKFFEPMSYLILLFLSVIVIYILNSLILYYMIPPNFILSLPRRLGGFAFWMLYIVIVKVTARLLIVLLLKQWFLVINGLILLPQIIKNFYGNSPVAFDCAFIKHFCITKFGYFFYLRWFSHNVVGREPNHGLLVVASCLLYFSMKILELQSKYGPCEIMPKFLDEFIKYKQQRQANAETQENRVNVNHPQAEPNPVPVQARPIDENRQVIRWNDVEQNQFNLEHSINIMSENSISMNLCKICLTNIEKTEEPQQNQPGNSGRRRARKATAKVVMKTPCGHEFHTECLKLWIKSSKECPVCRAVIEYLPA